jgi:hypothetical protein
MGLDSSEGAEYSWLPNSATFVNVSSKKEHQSDAELVLNWRNGIYSLC